jgi:ribosomal protein S18 acetylase RimI-like enzyme
VYHLSACTLQVLQHAEEADVLGHLLADMDPWRTLRYTPEALQRYLLRPDSTLYRYVVTVQANLIGAVCIRYPWLRGAYLELIGLAAAYQARGAGGEILHWLETQTRLAARNVWVVVAAFNTGACRFYARHGYSAIGTLTDFVQPGYDEVLLRKVL